MSSVPHPFYYPTSIAIIDDNTDFLVNFSLQLNEKLAFTLHPSPVEGLKFINSAPTSNALTQKFIKSHTDVIDDEYVDNVLVVNTAGIVNELSNPERFQEISIVIVDFEMPQLNGIDLCKQIDNPNIKKILLTGVADEKVAVEAFNDGVIDKFIKKSDINAVDRISKHITDFQNDYFKRKTFLIKNALNTEVYGFIQEPAFVELFKQIVETHQITEYYLTNSPSGYLMIGADDTPYHLIVQSEIDLLSQAEIVTEQDGPQALYDKLQEKSVIPNFFATGGFFSPDIDDWQRYVHPATALNTAENHYYTLIASPEYYTDLMSKVFTYNTYLAALDEKYQNEHFSK